MKIKKIPIIDVSTGKIIKAWEKEKLLKHGPLVKGAEFLITKPIYYNVRTDSWVSREPKERYRFVNQNRHIIYDGKHPVTRDFVFVVVGGGFAPIYMKPEEFNMLRTQGILLEI